MSQSISFWKQEAKLLPGDHAMHNVNPNLNPNDNPQTISRSSSRVKVIGQIHGHKRKMFPFLFRWRTHITDWNVLSEVGKTRCGAVWKNTDSNTTAPISAWHGRRVCSTQYPVPVGCSSGSYIPYDSKTANIAVWQDRPRMLSAHHYWWITLQIGR